MRRVSGATNCSAFLLELTTLLRFYALLPPCSQAKLDVQLSALTFRQWTLFTRHQIFNSKVRAYAISLGQIVDGFIARELGLSLHSMPFLDVAREVSLPRVLLAESELSTICTNRDSTIAPITSTTASLRRDASTRVAFDSGIAGLLVELGYLKEHITSLVRPNRANLEQGLLLLLSMARHLLPRRAPSSRDRKEPACAPYVYRWSQFHSQLDPSRPSKTQLRAFHRLTKYVSPIRLLKRMLKELNDVLEQALKPRSQGRGAFQ